MLNPSLEIMPEICASMFGPFQNPSQLVNHKGRQCELLFATWHSSASTEFPDVPESDLPARSQTSDLRSPYFSVLPPKSNQNKKFPWSLPFPRWLGPVRNLSTPVIVVIPFSKIPISALLMYATTNFSLFKINYTI